MIFQNRIAVVSVHAGLGGSELAVDRGPEIGGGYEPDVASGPLIGIGTKAWLFGTY
jgi:hypothetical protein